VLVTEQDANLRRHLALLRSLGNHLLHLPIHSMQARQSTNRIAQIEPQGMRGRTTHLGGGRLEPGRRSPLVRQRRRRDTLPAARRRAPAIRTHEIHSRSNEWRGREGERLTRGCAYAPWRRIGVYLRRRRGGGLLLQRRRRRREGERRRVRR
jgi:hypothetical protein